MSAKKWASGITTVPSRFNTYLPKTLASLKAAGFDPHVFVDQVNSEKDREAADLATKGRLSTYRTPGIKTAGHWILSLAELYWRNPLCDYYAMFQDDCVISRNVQEYLSRVEWPQKGYINGYTFPAKGEAEGNEHEQRKPDKEGIFRANQQGYGALAIFLPKEAVTDILTSYGHIWQRCQTAGRRKDQAIDGGIVDSLKKKGWHENCHNPSIVQHIGDRSSMRHGKFAKSVIFRGEDFDMLSLLSENERAKANGPMNPKKQVYDRHERKDKFRFEEALKLSEGVIVEIGTIRDARPIAKDADGHSTIYWGNSGRETWSVEIDAKALSTARKLVDKESPNNNVTYVHRDGVALLETFNTQIGLLYLDGPDVNMRGDEFSRRCIERANFADSAVVLIDDIDIGENGGKSNGCIPLLEEKGFEVVEDSHDYKRQLLMRRTATKSAAEEPSSEKPIETSSKGRQRVVEPTVVVKPTRLRIGLVGYNCCSGLGMFNRQAATYADIDTWLVKPNKGLQTLPPHEEVDTVTCPNGSDRKLNGWLKAVDIVLYFETPYYRAFAQRCKRSGKRTVCVPMLEWTPDNRNNWTAQTDLFICPTQVCYDTLKAEGLPCVYFPWPTDLKFPYVNRKVCKKFLFLHGRGGYKGRKGGAFITEALKLWPEMPLICRSQTTVGLEGPNVEIIKPGKSNEDLYEHGDILIAPHRLDGYGLEPIEAMTAGMPVITPDGLPWNEFPAIHRIKTTHKASRATRSRSMDWYECDPQDIVNACKRFLGTDISKESNHCRKWAYEKRWEEETQQKFNDLVRFGQPDE